VLVFLILGPDVRGVRFDQSWPPRSFCVRGEFRLTPCVRID
jgi:hypothetical protein